MMKKKTKKNLKKEKKNKKNHENKEPEPGRSNYPWALLLLWALSNFLSIFYPFSIDLRSLLPLVLLKSLEQRKEGGGRLGGKEKSQTER
ncbi:hypothetical protein OROMI_015594 [Orobanche minor]